MSEVSQYRGGADQERDDERRDANARAVRRAAPARRHPSRLPSERNTFNHAKTVVI